MSRRRLLSPAGLVSALLLCTGCQSRQNAGVISDAPTGSSFDQAVGRPTTKPELATTVEPRQPELDRKILV
jgi:hypothetical protein